MLPCPMFTLSLEGFSSQSSESPSSSPGLSLLCNPTFRPRSAAALAPQLSPCPCTGSSSDKRLSYSRPLLARPSAASFCSLTEQNESKKRPLFSYAYKDSSMQLLYCYIFTKTGGVFSSNFHLHPRRRSLRRYFFTSPLRLSSHGTNAPLPRLHRCRGEIHA
jgi:hypothetical protein